MNRNRENRIYWNRGWTFFEEYTPALCEKETAGFPEGTEVELPHTAAVTPLHYFDESIYQKHCAYRKCFVPEKDWEGKRIFLNIEAAGHSARVYLNGILLTEHFCGYTAFQAELTAGIRQEMENVLLIEVDSRESQDLPPFGRAIDYMTFGGLYREVYLDIREKYCITDVFARTEKVMEEKPVLSSEITLDTGKEIRQLSQDNWEDWQEKLQTEGLMIRQSLLFTEQTEEGPTSGIYLLTKNELVHEVEGVKLWSPEDPFLYLFRTELYREGKLLDTYDVRIGFREAEFRKDGFYLNGKKLKIRGLNRHQSYPYVGYAMPASMQRQDADILKQELSVNAVRTSHYPQSQHFIDRCDEIGLLVFTEIPGWQYVGGEKWQEQAVKNTEEMILQYRNHPSIILWGVRINESEDNDPFYHRTNETAHRLDPGRQTSGVRYLQKSSLLEDVYAFNDFSHEGNNRGCRKKKAVTPDPEKGYLISEYNGHMYPTKTFDSEGHRTEHMLRHARVMDAYYGEEDIAGGFGWCMFDYNTHKDFGSGDRVCYHGVMDAFRNPKLAAALYQSQGEEETVLKISSSMDIGEYPASLIRNVYAVTNADSIRVYKNEELVGTFETGDSPFRNLPHGPILLDDFIGDLLETKEGFSKEKAADVKKVLLSIAKNGLNHIPFGTILIALKCVLFRGMKMQDAVELYNKYIGNWGGIATEYRFEAVKDGVVVFTVRKGPARQPHLKTRVSDNHLVIGDTYDVAEIRLMAESEYGDTLCFCQEALKLRTEGPIALIGPEMISLNGGMGGVYVRTTGEEGRAVLILSSGLFGEIRIDFTVEKEVL